MIYALNEQHYEDSIKKYKGKIIRNSDYFADELNAKRYLKMGLLNEIRTKADKSLKNYESAYKITSERLNFYSD